MNITPPNILNYQGQQARFSGPGQQRGTWNYMIIATRFQFSVQAAEIVSVGPLYALASLMEDPSKMGPVKLGIGSFLVSNPSKGSVGMIAFLGVEGGRPTAGAFWEMKPAPAPIPAPSQNGRASGCILKSSPGQGIVIRENGGRERIFNASPAQSAQVENLPQGTPVSFGVASINGKAAAIEDRPLRLA